MINMNIYFILSACLLIVNSCSKQEGAAKIVELKIEGISNFYEVSPSLYRSARPDSIGMEKISEMGIKTLIDLRTFRTERCQHLPIEQVHIPMMIWPLDETELIELIQILASSEKSPLLIHCLRGSDRTGAVVALYRVVVQDWSKEDSILEMVHGGFGYQRWRLPLTNWIWNLNVEEIRKSAGLQRSSAGEYVLITSE